MDRLIVEHWLPIDPAVSRLPDPSRGRTHEVNHSVAGHTGNRAHSITYRSDMPVAQRFVLFGSQLLGRGCSPDEKDECPKDEESREIGCQ